MNVKVTAAKTWQKMHFQRYIYKAYIATSDNETYFSGSLSR